MGIKASVATDKARIVTYCDPKVKAKLEKLASLRLRSLSNLVESILTEAVEDAALYGELNESVNPEEKK